MARRVVDLDAVRASRARLAALASAHPELLDREHRERLAAALAEGINDEEEDEEEAPDDIRPR